MTKQNAQETLDLLCSSFKLPLLKIQWTRGYVQWGLFTTYGKGKRCEIHISINAPDIEKTLLHEMAHYVEFAQQGYPLVTSRHSKVFCMALNKVLSEYYGDVHRYPWGREYKRVQSWYKKTYDQEALVPLPHMITNRRILA